MMTIKLVFENSSVITDVATTITEVEQIFVKNDIPKGKNSDRLVEIIRVDKGVFETKKHFSVLIRMLNDSYKKDGKFNREYIFLTEAFIGIVSSGVDSLVKQFIRSSIKEKNQLKAKETLDKINDLILKNEPLSA